MLCWFYLRTAVRKWEWSFTTLLQNITIILQLSQRVSEDSRVIACEMANEQ